MKRYKITFALPWGTPGSYQLDLIPDGPDYYVTMPGAELNAARMLRAFRERGDKRPWMATIWEVNFITSPLDKNPGVSNTKRIKDVSLDET